LQELQHGRAEFKQLAPAPLHAVHEDIPVFMLNAHTYPAGQLVEVHILETPLSKLARRDTASPAARTPGAVSITATITATTRILAATHRKGVPHVSRHRYHATGQGLNAKG
jgi:hypothetical protein